jgi:hypothetical protein
VSQNGNGVVVRGEQLPAFRTIEEWGAGLHWLVKFHREWKWRIAEYLVKGQETFNEQIWQYIDPSELKFKTQQEVSNAIWTFRQIRDQYTPEAELSFDMWRELASLKPAQRDPFITRALSGEKIHRDEIRALAAPRNGFKAIGARNGSDALESTADAVGSLPDARGLALQAFVDALAVSGKVAVRFGKGEPINGLLADALDELIAKAMILRGMVADAGS